MKIYSELTIEDFISEFSKNLPGLKIELYTKSHDEGEGSKHSEQIDHSKTLGELNPKLEGGELNIDPQMTVADFEAHCNVKYGFHIQVFRRSNDLWLQTSSTDDWSLEKQNDKGLRSVQS